MDNNIARLKFPVNIDYVTRAKTGLSRSADLFNDSKKMLENAKSLFEKALLLDNSYIPSKQNLSILKFLDSNSKKTLKDFFKTSEYKNLEREIQIDLKIISMILEGERSKKIEKFISEGTNRSLYNLYESGNQIESKINVFSKFKIDESIRIFGSERPYELVNTQYGNLKFKFKEEENFIIYELGDKYLIESSPDHTNKDTGIFYNNRVFYLVK